MDTVIRALTLHHLASHQLVRGPDRPELDGLVAEWAPRFVPAAHAVVEALAREAAGSTELTDLNALRARAEAQGRDGCVEPQLALAALEIAERAVARARLSEWDARQWHAEAQAARRAENDAKAGANALDLLRVAQAARRYRDAELAAPAVLRGRAVAEAERALDDALTRAGYDSGQGIE